MTGNASAITASITALLAIMGDEGESMRRRVDAAEALLTYETPEEITERAKAFLTTLLEDRNRITTDYRLEASRLLRKAEARKIVQQSARSADADRWRETMRQLAIRRRRVRLVEAGLWPAPKGWYDDLLLVPDNPDPAATSG